MLVLRRRAGEALVIGGGIEIEFLELSPQWVKVGIRAPKEVTILRKELQVVAEENLAAALEADLERLPDALKFFPT